MYAFLASRPTSMTSVLTPGGGFRRTSSALVYDSDQEVTLNQVARSVGDDFLKAQEHRVIYDQARGL
jgi:hypothetical protein